MPVEISNGALDFAEILILLWGSIVRCAKSLGNTCLTCSVYSTIRFYRPFFPLLYSYYFRHRPFPNFGYNRRFPRCILMSNYCIIAQSVVIQIPVIAGLLLYSLQLIRLTPPSVCGIAKGFKVLKRA